MIVAQMRGAAVGLAVVALGAAAPLTPEQVWKAGIAYENKDYAHAPHAMLKIQDAAYLGEGQSAVLVGRKGQSSSWHWTYDAKAKGMIRVSLAGGKLMMMESGRVLNSSQILKSIAVDKDVDIAGQPTQVNAGIQGWRIFVYNQKAFAVKNFTGVSYFPYDSAFRVTARFTRDPKLAPHVFRTSRGTDKQFYHAGDAHFVLQGHAITLPFYSDSGTTAEVKDMTAFYTDTLTGHGAYGAGRYVDAEAFGKFPPTTVIIDFNDAYNPNCARSAFFTCPVAIDHITLAMKAGERDPHSPH